MFQNMEKNDRVNLSNILFSCTTHILSNVVCMEFMYGIQPNMLRKGIDSKLRKSLLLFIQNRTFLQEFTLAL